MPTLFIALLLFGQTRFLAAADSPIRFQDISKSAGMMMSPRDKHPDKKIARGQKNFKDVYARGYFWDIRDICFVDVNGDGHIDIFMLNAPHSQWSRLWLGNGEGGFAEVGGGNLGGDWKEYHRVLAFDFNGKGTQDIFLTGNLQLGYNDPRRRGTASARLRIVDPKKRTVDTLRMVRTFIWFESSTLLISDFDRDGVVDFATGPVPTRRGYRGGNILKSGFVSSSAGIVLDRTEVPLSVGTQSVAADFDGDGKIDVLSRGYFTKPTLVKNMGRRRFHNATPGSGLEAMPSGGPVAVADFNNDGMLDIFCAGAGGWNSRSRKPTSGSVRLYINQGNLKFVDATAKSGLLPEKKTSFPQLFGTAAALDADNDGWMDIFLCSGETNLLYRNKGKAVFEEISRASGIPEKAAKESANAAGDIDADGMIDLVYITPAKGIGLLKNTSSPDNGWIKVKLKGPRGNLEAAGAQVTVFEAGRLGQKEAILGYQENIFSTDFRMPRPLHFGLGSNTSCDIRARFLSGKTMERKGVSAKTLITFDNGQ